MPLTAYFPLEHVYAFHEAAETWILRRFPPAVEVADGAERVRSAPWSESPIALFRDRSTKSTAQRDAGQTAPQTCTVYTRTRLRTTEDATDATHDADVLFDPVTLSAWQVTSSGDWDEARGYAVTLTRCGVRGQSPWV